MRSAMMHDNSNYVQVGKVPEDIETVVVSNASMIKYNITYGCCHWIIDPLVDDFIWPKKAEKDSVAYDLFYQGKEEMRIEPVMKSGKVHKVSLGFRAKISNGWYGQIFMRSGLALKYNLGLANSVGIIDNSFRDEWAVLLINRSESFYYLRRGVAIAQLIMTPMYTMEMEHWDKVGEWNDSDRKGGFGHSGNC